MTLRNLAALAACLGVTGCFIDRSQEARDDFRTDFRVDAASQFNHRGMPQNERGVAQVQLDTYLPVRDGGTLRLKTFGNMDLSNSTGDAWFPNGHAGKFTQVDFMAAYTRSVGEWDLTAGVQAYILPNGLEFPFGQRGETKEVFVEAGRAVGDFYPALRLFYDFDEVEDLYAQGSVRYDLPIDEDWAADFELTLGYSGEDQSVWNYGIAESGLADLRGVGSVYYAWDEFTEVRAQIGLSTILDSGIEDWFEAIDIESDNAWVTLGVGWSF